MKKIFSFILIISALFTASCKKEDAIMKYVGSYSLVGSEYVTWGRDSGTLNVNGSFAILPLEGNNFKVTGYYNTTGRIIGNTLHFDTYRSSDGYGYMDISIHSTTLIGNTMNISVTSSGQLPSNGVLYPYTGRVTAVATKRAY